MNEELITNESGVLPEDRKLIEEEPIITEIETELDWPETPTTDPTHNYQAAPKKYTDDQKTAAEVVAQAYTDGKLVVVPSDNLKLSSDAEVTGDNATYTKLKEITSTVTGKIKTKFDLKQILGPNGTIAGKIYINGVAIGEEHLQTLATYTTYEDASIDVVVGDLIQVYVMTVDSNRVQSIKNFRLYWDVSIPGYINNALNFPVFGDFEFVASDVLRQSNDTEKTTQSTSYVKLKEIKIDSGTLTKYRIKFDIKSDAGNNAYLRVYKNGVAIGTEQSVYANTSYTTKSEDFTVSLTANDLLQVYGKTDDAGYITYVRNFRIYYSYQLETVDEYTLTTPISVTGVPVITYTNQDP